jgi:hypothetical protein
MRTDAFLLGHHWHDTKANESNDKQRFDFIHDEFSFVLFMTLRPDSKLLAAGRDYSCPVF